jgi:hypothetical protein
MFYVIDNRLITICQRLVWRIELFTSLGRKGVARLIFFVHSIFTATLLFFAFSAYMNGSFEASAMNMSFILPLFAFHFFKLVSMNRMKAKGDVSLTGEVWRRPEAVVKRRETRKVMFAISIFILLFFLYIFSLSQADMDSIILWITVTVIMSPWVNFLSEYFFCTVSLPIHVQEWKEKRKKGQGDDIW